MGFFGTHTGITHFQVIGERVEYECFMQHALSIRVNTRLEKSYRNSYTIFLDM